MSRVRENRTPGSMRRREESGANGLRAPRLLAPPADPTATAKAGETLATRRKRKRAHHAPTNPTYASRMDWSNPARMQERGTASDLAPPGASFVQAIVTGAAARCQLRWPTTLSAGGVVVEPHAGCADPGRQHALHRVVPGQTFMDQATPVRRPAQVGGGCQTLLKPVELVRSDEVHLPGQAGRVAGGPQVVRERRQRGSQLCAVVEDLDSRWKPAGQERGARRRTERRSTVRALEHDARVHERRDARRLDDGVPVCG